ncbi:MAG: rhamnosidase, partial [Glaciecola sp.]|nr:rhamnosidase [Glaciecola sp.]
MLLVLKNTVKLAYIVVAMSAVSACMSDFSSEFVGRTGPSPIALKVGEGFVNPTGYYESQPRFSWQLSSDSVSNIQTAYQLQVASTPQLLDLSPDLWESQKTTSPSTTWIKYQGKTLASRQTLYWRVRTWNEQDQLSDWSEIQTIEYGLLTNNDWQAQWIGHPDTAMPSDDTVDIPSQETLATPQYLRKSFEVSGTIKKARLYITAKGLFKPFINGDEVSKVDVMTPGWTPYAKRIESLSYALTERLVIGENTIAASIAGGWYAGRMANFVEKEHRLPARLLAQLEITYEDNTVQYVVTDNSWYSSQEGPIRFASIFDGERYDQDKEQPGWNANDFSNKGWLNTITEPLESDVAIVPKRHAPIRITEQMPVSKIVSVNDDVVVMDFGQNMVGVPKLSIPGIAGQQI